MGAAGAGLVFAASGATSGSGCVASNAAGSARPRITGTGAGAGSARGRGAARGREARRGRRGGHRRVEQGELELQAQPAGAHPGGSIAAEPMGRGDQARPRRRSRTQSPASSRSRMASTTWSRNTRRSRPRSSSPSSSAMPGGGVAARQGASTNASTSLGVGEAQQVAHGLGLDPAARRRQQLVEDRLGVAHAAGGEPGDEARSPRVGLAAVGRQDPLELAADLGDVSRRTSNRWSRDRIAGGNSCGWVIANMKVTNSGGSSSDLRSAFQASRVIWCASSRM